MKTKLSNLDELLIKCRNPNAKELMKEALACYNSESYRSAIICIWQAIAFDFTDKIQEISAENIKDQNIVKLNQELNDIKTGLSLTPNDDAIRKAQAFEKNIIKDKLLVKHLGLSENENREIEKIYYDRHRCAHPALYEKEVHSFTPELAISHYVHAINYILGRGILYNDTIFIRELNDFLDKSYIKNTENIRNYVNKYFLSIREISFKKILSEVLFNINIDDIIGSDKVKEEKIKILLEELKKSYEEKFISFLKDKSEKLISSRENNQDKLLAIKSILNLIRFDDLSDIPDDPIKPQILEFILNNINNKDLYEINELYTIDTSLSKELRLRLELDSKLDKLFNIDEPTYNRFNSYWYEHILPIKDLLTDEDNKKIYKRINDKKDGMRISDPIRSYLIDKEFSLENI